MSENTLKQNTLAHLLGWAAVVVAAALLLAAAVSAQELSAEIQAATREAKRYVRKILSYYGAFLEPSDVEAVVQGERS